MEVFVPPQNRGEEELLHLRVPGGPPDVGLIWGQFPFTAAGTYRFGMSPMNY